MQRTTGRTNVLRYLPIAFIAGFFLELASLIWVGGRIGVAATLLLIVLGFVAGAAVIRRSGTGLTARLGNVDYRRQFSTADAGVVFLRMIAGVLFMIPGFFSDAAALVLLLPPVARRIAKALAPEVQVHYRREDASDFAGGPVIEGEAMELDREALPPSSSLSGR